jgi:integrase
MARQVTFPITVMAGGTAIKIYRSPLKVPASPPPGDSPVGSSETKSYDSYVVAYYRGSQRLRRRFSTLQEARDNADSVRTALLNEDTTALQLTGQDSVIYARAKNLIAEFGIGLDQVAQEYKDTRDVLGKTSLMEAARFYERFGKTVKEAKTIPAIVEELNANLRADNKSSYHVRDMKRRLETFALAFPRPIMEVTTKEISDWLRGLRGSNKRGEAVELAPKSRNHYRNSVVQLFNHARDHGYLPKGMPTEAEAVKTLDVVPSTNEIFTVPEIEKVLSTAPSWMVVPMAIKAFCGVRTEEMLHLQWEHVNLATKYITLPSEVTKTKQRRLVPISDNLVAWLTPHLKTSGPICPRWGRAQALFQAFDRHGRRQGIDVGANKFRNSYISYRVALTHDVAKVALESGNSPRVIQREYLELATEEEGKKWFAVYPKSAHTPRQSREAKKRTDKHRTPEKIAEVKKENIDP